MASQKSRSREAVRSIDMTAGHALGDLAQQLGSTSFIGYEHGPLQAPGSVLAIFCGGSSVESASKGLPRNGSVTCACRCTCQMSAFQLDMGLLDRTMLGTSGQPDAIHLLTWSPSIWQFTRTVWGCQGGSNNFGLFHLFVVVDPQKRPLQCAGDEVEVILDSTPFYAESGGQVGDSGRFTSIESSSGGNGAASPSGSVLDVHVHDTQKAGGGALVVHHGRIERGDLHVGQMVRLS